RAMGEWFRQHGLKPQAVLSSQWCRCLDTARLALGRVEAWPALNSTFAGQGQPDRQLVELRERLRTRPAGLLEVWVTHQVIMTARQLFERFSPAEDSPEELLAQIVEDAHTVIQLTAISAEQEPHSTIAAFMVLPTGQSHWVHVGDSRVHHFHRGTPVFRTTDHSYVQTLVAQGKLAPEDAESHPKSNMLLESLGSKRAPKHTLHLIEQLSPGDALVACSDGLWHYVSDDEMAILVERLAAPEAAQAMVQRARDRANGGGDNISVAIIKVEPLAG
ncbi:MAG: protein phosphatase 2C domain-containing protein, partial [Burkholderiaceae bacterium]